jgi:hypothetical protein
MVKAIVEYPVIISGDTITLQMNGTPNYLPNNEEYALPSPHKTGD